MVRLKAALSYQQCARSIISIPVWCDWKHNSNYKRGMVSIISIPVWCDWKMIDNILKKYGVGYFNSSMVRLKVFPWNAPCPSRLFQFQYGAIERWRTPLEQPHRRDFNSSMVRLKVQQYAVNINLLLFQFQYGAIERSRVHSVKALLRNFNSSMVRLKEPVNTPCPGIYRISIPVWCDWKLFIKKMVNMWLSDFNSSMVRLKELIMQLASFYLINFNSSMVRLKDNSKVITSLCQWVFQFQYGAIERFGENLKKFRKNNFNSSMVRLKVWLYFTFVNFICISIPVWCDWKNGGSIWTGNPFRFQFQYGAIESKSWYKQPR